MSKIKYLISSVLIFSVFSANCYSENLSDVSIVPGIYSVKTEITMPNLTENLRYATTYTRQCIDRQQAFSIFPILTQGSFLGCALVENQNNSAQEDFDLVCINPTAASGVARFIVSEASFHATLDVKMGGKNMKFTQHVSGHRISACNKVK